jgi:4,5-DOPA dioxygenase extradiol
MSLMPTLFVSHGAPTFALAPGLLGPRLTALGEALPRPGAVLVVSPHWRTRELRTTTTKTPATIHDFGGFDDALYDLVYPAKGAPQVAARTAELLNRAGWRARADEQRGLDHGAWVPLRHLYPLADVPAFQLSMPAELTSASAYALGSALAPLREEGILIVGSGSLTHNLYEFRSSEDDAEAEYAKQFAAWARRTVTSRDHDILLRTMELAPNAQRAHPTLEHLVPLMLAAGAAGPDAPATVIEGGIAHGVLAMDSFVFGQIERMR